MELKKRDREGNRYSRERKGDEKEIGKREREQ